MFTNKINRKVILIKSLLKQTFEYDSCKKIPKNGLDIYKIPALILSQDTI